MVDGLKRPVRTATQNALFDLPPDWKSEWWGMPEFTMGDATPQYRVTINFLTLEDLIEFGSRMGIALTAKSNSAWYPPQQKLSDLGWKYVDA